MLEPPRRALLYTENARKKVQSVHALSSMNLINELIFMLITYKLFRISQNIKIKY